MTAASIVSKFERRGCKFSVVDERFKVDGPRESLSKLDVQLLKTNKAEILHFLEVRDRELGEAMAEAIEMLSTMCPPTLFDLLDSRQQRECKALGELPLRSVADVKNWTDRWRTLFAEVKIDESNMGAF